MHQFQLGPDQVVIVRGDEGTYADTPAHFALDFAATPPDLDAGFSWAIYNQDTGLLCGVNTSGTQLPYSTALQQFAVNVIPRLAAGLAAKKARTAPPEAP